MAGISIAFLLATGTLPALNARMTFSHDCLPAVSSTKRVAAIDNRTPRQLLGYLPDMTPLAFDGELGGSLSFPGPLPTYQGPWYLFKINHRKGSPTPITKL